MSVRESERRREKERERGRERETDPPARPPLQRRLCHAHANHCGEAHTSFHSARSQRKQASEGKINLVIHTDTHTLTRTHTQTDTHTQTLTHTHLKCVLAAVSNEEEGGRAVGGAVCALAVLWRDA